MHDYTAGAVPSRKRKAISGNNSRYGIAGKENEQMKDKVICCGAAQRQLVTPYVRRNLRG